MEKHELSTVRLRCHSKCNHQRLEELFVADKLYAAGLKLIKLELTNLCRQLIPG